MTDNKLFVQRIGLVGITTLLLSLSNIILLPILTKNLSIDEYGIWAQIIVTVSIIPGITMLGLPFTMTRFLPSIKNKDEIQDIFYSILLIVLVTSGFSCLLIYLLSETIAYTLFDENIVIVKIVAIIAFVECINSVFYGYFRATQQIKNYSIFNIIKTVLYLTIISIAIFIDGGIIGIVIALLLRNLILFLIMAYFIIKNLGLKTPKFNHTRELLSYSIPTIPINFSRWIVESSDRYVIGLFLGTAAVGYYSPGYALGNTINMIIAPLSFILPATLSKYHDENNLDEVKNILNKSKRYFFIIAIPSVFGLSILSKPILSIFTTTEIASNGYFIIPFTAISALFFGIITIFNQILLLEKKTEMTGKIVSFCAILNLGFNFILIPYIGIIGAAITTLFAYTVNLIFILYYSSKFLKLEIDLIFIIKCIISSIIMCLIIIGFNQRGLLDLIVTIGLCAGSYFAMLFLFKCFNEDELALIKSIIK
jgi:O-antigen/teichoic acid export membrane protein